MTDQLPYPDTAWGIDRYPASPAYGSLAVPVIYLWKHPGAAASKENLTGAVKHGTAVSVTNSRDHDGEKWLFIKQDVRVNGKTHPQRGWCKAKFLLNLGEKYCRFGEPMTRERALSAVREVAAASPFRSKEVKA